MFANQITYNSKFAPKITIYNTNMEEVLSSEAVSEVLQSMQFSLSVNDISGGFSITLFPENQKKESIYDKLNILDIVQIEEPSDPTGIFYTPVFTGIIKTKKSTNQASLNGGIRRISISGIAITGLVSEFKINLDTTAMAITKQLQANEAIQKSLTIDFGGDKNKPVKEVIKTIWKKFLEVSQKLGNPKVAQIIDLSMGGVDQFFCIDDSSFYYPLGSVFRGEQTQDFFNIIENIIPSPIYEKFPFMGNDGKMKIMIRECPFSPEVWKVNTKFDGGLRRNSISKTLLKSFEFSESDKEVYTVFYSYLNGSPIDEKKALILSTMLYEQTDPSLIVSESRYQTYGYRPLIAHFIGYGKKEGKDDDSTLNNLKKANEKLKSWYENLPYMLSGHITLAMSYQEERAIMPGDVVEFLKNEAGEAWAEFYVEGITHSWTYGQGGEIQLSVSRGGRYIDGKWNKRDNVGKFSMFSGGQS